ncbi:hypothetical protein [Bacteroides nordii]|uniref:hypothetical protein n=1 Tax=Bacteroides nordii TaxID=291645 RepID=UPI002A808A49|nr:hypothetical protein [Bacteroides nordii]
MNELELKITEILGRAALDNDMQVPEDVQRLAKATRYLAMQLRITLCESDGDASGFWEILRKTTEILS